MIKKFTLLLIICLTLIGTTNATLSDTESSNNNNFTAGSVLMTLEPTSPSNYSKNIKINNVGSVDFKYQVTSLQTGDDTTVCQNTNLFLTQNGQIIFNSNLSDLSTTPIILLSNNFDNLIFNFAGDREGSCSFDLIFKAWQTNSDGSWGMTDTKSISNSISFDSTPPVTEIINLPYQTNRDDLTINYTTTDIDIDTVDLCSSFNLGDYFCQNSLDFNFDKGDGTYYFYTKATDKSGNIEDPKPDYSVGTIFDTTAPTTNLLNPTTPYFTGQNLLTSNLFEQDFYLPQNYSGNLELSYRFTSNDIGSNDHFDVGIYFQDGLKLIKKIVTDGNNTSSPTYDSGWQNISQSLTDLSNRLLKLVISVTDTGDGVGYDSSVLINNLKISSLDIRTGDTSPAQFLSLDLGSGIGDTSVLIDNYYSTDLAQNSETPKTMSIVTLPPVVLNKITSSIVTLYNNTDSSIDLSTYVLDIGTTSILSGTIPSYNSLNISLTVGTTSVKLLNNSIIVDSTTFEPLGSSTWQRSSDGLGPWIMQNSPLSFDLASRLSESKISLSVFGLNSTVTNRDYEIIYTSDGVEKGFGGTLLPSIISQDFFLGTCSTGTCLPSSNIGSSFVVTFSGITKTFILN